VAQGPNDIPIATQLECLAAKIAEPAKTLSTPQDNVWDLRYKAHRAAQQVVALTQKPEEMWLGQSIAMCEFPAIRVFMKWKAFENIPFKGSISYKELTKECDAEESILSELLDLISTTLHY
jgi:hypothetical protein